MKMYRAIGKYRLHKELILSRRKAPKLSVQSAGQLKIHKQASEASLTALRYISLYMACDLLAITIYPAATIYAYANGSERNPTVSYALELTAGAFISLQVVWVCLLFRAFSAIAIGDRGPRISIAAPQAPLPAELGSNEAKTNILVKNYRIDTLR